MRYLSAVTLLSCTIACATTQTTEPASEAEAATEDTMNQADPYLWLEEVEGEKALNWVQDQNKSSLAHFEADPRYNQYLESAVDLLNAKDRIPYGAVRGGVIYNFWQDETNVRGLWRKTTPESYRTDDPQWETILDFDKLAADENENWVYKGSVCLAPDFTRCMLRLSRGGKDASVYREFDIATKSFVAGGFELPEAKSSVDWVDENTLSVATDWGENTLTTSGYPRITKLWKRGTPLKSAETLLEGKTEDMGVWPMNLHTPDVNLVGVVKYMSFYTHEYYLRKADGSLFKLPIQNSASLNEFYKGRFLISLREKWEHQGQTYAQGTLLAIDANSVIETGKIDKVEVLVTPDQRTSIEGVSASKSGLFVTLLQNVRSKVLKMDVSPEGTWSSKEVNLPNTGSIYVGSANAFDDLIFFSYEDHITPDTLYEFIPGQADLKPIKSLPARFDASNLVVEQFEAKSADGELVPYFLIRAKDTVFNGETPTILYGYGGFEISLTPSYSSTRGKLWLERGGAYAIANIRGGGEFGPRWHRAALKENRQRAYDDFFAVAQDLIDRKVTQPKNLGIMGGSNGGLLVGVGLTQRPDLFNAVVCQVPLLDMIRYTKLLAGASWAAEYGDPEDPEMRKVIEKYSPYQNVKKDTEYPKAFIMTSTKDDRVHPGHARKMVARLMEYGHPVYYYENTEGGHAAAANLKQRARRYALEYVYLSQELGLK